MTFCLYDPPQLLTRDPTKRLGTSDAAEIKKHPFFRSIDWDKLFKKEVEPTFKPKVKSEADISQVSSDPVLFEALPCSWF
jgi:serum/glucocorticoid-regulated kinase 2